MTALMDGAGNDRGKSVVLVQFQHGRSGLAARFLSLRGAKRRGNLILQRQGKIATALQASQ